MMIGRGQGEFNTFFALLDSGGLSGSFGDVLV